MEIKFVGIKQRPKYIPTNIDNEFVPTRWKADYSTLGKFFYVVSKCKATGKYIAIIAGKYPIGLFDTEEDALRAVLYFVRNID